MVAFPRSRLVQKTLFDLPTPARVEPTPEPLPEVTPELQAEPEVQEPTSFTCGCGSVISLTNKAHVKTQKHLLWELSQVELNGQNDELVRQGGFGEDETGQEL